MSAKYYKKVGLKIVQKNNIDESLFPDKKIREIALDYIKNSRSKHALFTENGLFYIPMPVRAQYPKYMRYLCGSKKMSGSLAIIVIPSDNPEQPLGHTYPSLKDQSQGRYVPLHTSNNDPKTSSYFSGQQNFNVIYSIDEISAPIGAGIFISLNYRQNDVLTVDHKLAQYLVDVPKILNYRAWDKQGMPVPPSSGIVNCVTFTIDYFLKGAGIEINLPMTNNSTQLIELFRSFAISSLEVALDPGDLFLKGQKAPNICNLDYAPKITISQTCGLSTSNPVVFVDATETRKIIIHLEGTLKPPQRKLLQKFSENKLVAVLRLPL